MEEAGVDAIAGLQVLIDDVRQFNKPSQALGSGLQRSLVCTDLPAPAPTMTKPARPSPAHEDSWHSGACRTTHGCPSARSASTAAWVGEKGEIARAPGPASPSRPGQGPWRARRVQTHLQGRSNVHVQLRLKGADLKGRLEQLQLVQTPGQGQHAHVGPASAHPTPAHGRTHFSSSSRR